MKFEEFKKLRSMGSESRIDIEEFAVASIHRYLKPSRVENRKHNRYGFKYSIRFLYNNIERRDNSKEFKSLSKMKASFIPLFNSRNIQTEKQGKIETNF